MQYTPRHIPTQSTSLSDRRAGRPWSLRAVAGAVALASALTAGQAWALALGRVSVQSLLGEPLRAEIDVPSLSPEEASSLQIGVAPPERFRAAGMEFNPLLGDVTFELIQRPDGRRAIRLRSTRTVNEPFLDIVVQANWANGQLLRGYTLLFDPPNLRQAPAPLVPAVPAAPREAPAAPGAARVTPPSGPAQPAAAPVTPAAATTARQQQVNVARGDTAGRIAAVHKPAQVSLEQMLVGLLRANPHAFMGQNVNRLKAGVVLDLPDNDTLAAIPAAEARQLIAAQSRDFNDYRRRLAATAPSQATPAPSRTAAGTVQTEVTDTRAADTSQDKLTLSKGATATPQEDQIAQARQEAETSGRLSELNRNLEELEQLKAAVPAEPAGQAPVETAPPTETTPGVAVEAAPPVPPPAPAPTPAPAPAAEGAGLTQWLQHPMALPVAGGAAAALGLLALFALRRRRQDQALQAANAEGAPSQFDEAQGQTVDTHEDAPVSSMMYSPSQLDAGGDVDPVAEADVYLAYGRDKQAEEILQEALRLHPERLAVRAKLLEIYAQRGDVGAYNTEAQTLYDLTLGEGPEWAAARDGGLTLDPDNPLYRGGAVAAVQGPDSLSPQEALASQPPDLDLSLGDSQAAPLATETDSRAVGSFEIEAETPPTTEPVSFDFDLTQPSENPPTQSAVDLELDLDQLSAPSDEAAVPAATASPPPGPDALEFDLDLSVPAPEATPLAPAGETADEQDLGFDLDLTPPPEAPAPSSELPEEVKGLDLDLDLDLEGMADAAPTEERPVAQAATELDDLSSLEVDEGSGADPLETKLSLAREFEAIGDTDGARTLAEEVEAEATGELQARARAFLAQLS